ncbi:hypothetical protein D1007_53982 [Hordeum vulgare]|nr:hypothetical protein D1007_53982 [Hordeum vulgare]
MEELRANQEPDTPVPVARTYSSFGHVFLEPVCYVSRTIGGTGGDGSIIPPYAGRIRPVRTLKKRLRRRVVATGSSPPLVTLERSIGQVSNGNGSFHPPPLWIHDTGSSFSMTGDLSLLQGVHDAAEMRSHGVSGAELVSTKCGRIAGAVSLSGVRYFPGAMANLICGGLLGSLGCDIIQNAKGCTIIKGGQLIGGGRLLPNRTYSVDFLNDRLLSGTICSGCQHQYS